ncbi:UDP-N-acetylmuramoyl-L-alanine--D-glutamate ligase [Pseudothauera nasutitermitis]|uniref:UDP-N-acetylmuramoylalanine--D-glutamate ligase n=1 Tax=Pseudothauera nasutitermitis TaxID=2565930 RepID=A0A4S4AQ84_9RHOO|nr:UDP-N-acetylmuramoyl-L-alanine--D-glutamate ligase [Pseudothauera nasutitermitis]THF61898.1 UDP-N-acetylmuramoyl-L-alanine--D-glutamate ligase [Pseudothauera nasutitermitis]
MSALAGKLVLVLGLGESGLAMARWCARQGARLRVADTRARPPGSDELRRFAPQAELLTGAFTNALLDGVDLLALSPGLDPRGGVVAEARRRGLPVVGEMSLFAAALDELGARAATRVLAVTGTNGKTTTTALAAHLARAAGVDAVAAGNISPAPLAVLADRLDAGAALPACWVLELSSFQLEAAEGFGADAATVLNVTDDHLDRYAGLDEYAATKAHIFAGGGVQILNRQDARVAAMALPGRALRSFGTDAPTGPGDYGIVEADGRRWLAEGAQRVLALDELPLAGLHNAANALAALALCRAIGLPLDALAAGLKTFKGLPHRVELVAERADGVLFYNDSKGTNVGATLAALDGLARTVVLIAGGDGKGQDFSPLREPVARYARAVILIGRDAGHIADALAGCGSALEHAADLDAAVARANALAEPGDVVLLSPACSSLDMFRNYPQRAEVFVAAARRLPGVSPR